MNPKEEAQLAVISVKVDGINKRLDTMNSSIASTKGRVREVEDVILVLKNNNKLKIWAINNIVGVISAILIAYVVWKLKGG